MISREFLKGVSLFAALREEEAAELAALGHERVFRKGDVIFREGDAADRLYVVASGVVEVTKASPAGGRPLRLARLERGEVLGEIATFDGGPRSATATADVVPETRLAAWEGGEFTRFLAGRPEAAAPILRSMVARMSTRLRQTSEAVHILLRALEAVRG